jgi:hypothetical protein
MMLNRWIPETNKFTGNEINRNYLRWNIRTMG